jgi:hypothetical protein
MIALGGLLGLSTTTAGDQGEGFSAPATGPEYTRHVLTASDGVSVRGSLSSQVTTEPTCQKGKTILGTSANFVARGTLKIMTSDCQDCCTENIIFIDDFETGATTAWSSSVGAQ